MASCPTRSRPAQHRPGAATPSTMSDSLSRRDALKRLGALGALGTFGAQRGMSFLLPNGPLLGLGEGGPQFDRKGAADPMRNGQGGFRLATHGTRAPIQWLLGTDGWALFVHQPYGAFDFTGAEGKFTPSAESALPLDAFVVASPDPAVLLREY